MFEMDQVYEVTVSKILVTYLFLRMLCAYLIRWHMFL